MTQKNISEQIHKLRMYNLDYICHNFYNNIHSSIRVNNPTAVIPITIKNDLRRDILTYKKKK